MKRTLLVLVCAVMCVVAVSSAWGVEDEKISLKLNLKLGDKYKTTTVNDQQISQSVNGMAMDVNQFIEMIMFTEVTDISESGIISMKTTYGDIKFKMDTPQGSIAFDTARPDSNEVTDPSLEVMTQMYSLLKGVSVTMKIDSLGKVKSIEGIDEMLDLMFENFAEKDPNAGVAIKEMMKNFYNEDSLKEMSNGMFGSYPEGPVCKGEVWDSIMSFGGEQFPIDIDTTCMLKDVSGGVAVIELTSKMDMGMNEGKVVDMGGMKMNMVMSGVMNGHSKVDQASGWTMESLMDQSFSGSLKMDAVPGMPDGMTMPMSIKGKVSVKSEKI